MNQKPGPQNYNTAKLVIHKKKDETIHVMFNPDKYSIKKNNNFASHNIPGTNYPQIQFVSGESETMTVELFFDTYTFEDGEDVRKKYTNEIAKILKIDEDLHAPPTCTFVWGEYSFTGVVENFEQNFTMFNEQGRPVRATVTLSLKQYEEHKQITNSPDRTKRHTIKESDSLWMLAAQEYDDPSKWKIIASANHIDDPINLKSGMNITIPPLDD